MNEDSKIAPEYKEFEPESKPELVPEPPPELVPEPTPEPQNKPIRWNENKKIPRIYPGIIVSILLTILLPLTVFYPNLVLAGFTAFLFLPITIYWTFCVFRITGQLQYKSKALKIADRITALLIPLLGNPGVLVTFLGSALAESAMLVASVFHIYQEYAAHHSGPMVHIACIAHLLFSIVMVLIPLITIPTICMVWTYKFMVKVATVNEPVEKATFWKTRGPAILTLINNFICIEGWLLGLLSIGVSDSPFFFNVLIGFLTCGLCPTINFFILWRCVRKKEALA